MESSSIIARMSPLKATGIHAIVGMGDVELSSIIVELLPPGIRASEGMGGVEPLSIITEPSPSGAVCICTHEGMGVWYVAWSTVFLPLLGLRFSQEMEDLETVVS